MDRLRERLGIARQALDTFQEILRFERSAVVRDAAIQRFEYTFEAIWKAAQLLLKEREGVETASPKAAIRACFRTGMLNEEEARLGMNMAEDRNLTVHTYNEDLADAIYGKLPQYAALMQSWLAAMTRAAAPKPLE